MSDLSGFISHCNDILLNDQDREAVNAKHYLINDRNLFEESLKCHLIGYCKSDTTIPDPIRFYGTAHKPTSERWDISRYVKGRIIVPIYSEFGEVVAIATRVPTTEPGHPWWNLPSPFKKGNHLFQLNKARETMFKKNKVYIVEGYMDSFVLYQYGLKNVVAVMGTAYTLRKISLTARYCNNVCLCFDIDQNESGTKAKMMATAMLQKYNFCESISVIDDLPMKEDPASFVTANGIAPFLEMERVLDEEEIQRICRTISKSGKSRLLDAK